MKLQVYSDPGHGWVRVQKQLLVELGIQYKITGYSYMNGNYAYLEEDCDMATLVLALRNLGIEPEFVEHTTNRNSIIRSYYSYMPEGDWPEGDFTLTDDERSELGITA